MALIISANQWNHNKFILKVIKRQARIYLDKNLICLIYLSLNTKRIIEPLIQFLKQNLYKKNYISKLLNFPWKRNRNYYKSLNRISLYLDQAFGHQETGRKTIKNKIFLLNAA